MSVIRAVCFIKLMIMSALADAELELYSRFDVFGRSQPVPLSAMQNGWHGAFQMGEYVFADASWRTGVKWQGVSIEHEQRWYLNFTFSPSTSRFYYALENDQSSPDAKVELTTQAFAGDGIRLGKSFDFSLATITPSVSVLNVSDYQFGQLSGDSSNENGTVSASATLDYHFSEDKILAFEDDHNAGRFISLNLDAEFDLSSNWHAKVSMKDLWNRLSVDQALFTRACINIVRSGNTGANNCQSATSVSGRSGVEAFSESIPLRISAAFEQRIWQSQVLLDWHENFTRIGIRKDWATGYELGNLGMSAYSSRQIGIHWRSNFHELSLLLDDHRLSYARDAQLNLGLRYAW